MLWLSTRPYRAQVWAWLCLLGVLLMGSQAFAEVHEPDAPLSLRSALQLALRGNPDLVVTAYALKVGEARITQADVRPNPTVMVEVEDALGTGEARGFRDAQTTLSLSQVIELGDKRQRRVTTARLGRDLAAVEQQARQLDVLAEVTRRFIAVVQAQQLLEVAEQAVQLAEQGTTAIEARVQAARSPEAELSRARISVLRAQLDREAAKGSLQAARYALVALWGNAEPRFTVAEADLFALPETLEYSALLERIDRNPDFLRFASEQRVREAEWRLAQTKAQGDLTLSVGVRRREATDDAALVAGFSMPLKLFDHNQGNIREAELHREQTTAERESAYRRTSATLFGLYQHLQTHRERMRQLRANAIPLAEQALEQTRYGFERGRFSWLELTLAQRELLELQAAAIDAAATAQTVLADIERITGEAIAAP